MVFTGDFTMTVRANPNAANAETPVMVARSIEAEHMGKPVGGSRRIRSRQGSRTSFKRLTSFCDRRNKRDASLCSRLLNERRPVDYDRQRRFVFDPLVYQEELPIPRSYIRIEPRVVRSKSKQYSWRRRFHGVRTQT